MSFKIEYFSIHAKHITLDSDGSIELFDGADYIKIEYEQARILKAMIIAEDELSRRVDRR